MRIALAVVMLGGLLLAEAVWQRRQALLEDFVRGLRALQFTTENFADAMHRTTELLSGVSASFETARRVLADLR